MRQTIPLATILLSIGLASSNAEDLPVLSDIYVQPIVNLPANFIKGADFSTLHEVEQHGGQFFDEQGEQVDPVEIMAAHQINWARLRLWNNPYDVSWIKDEWPDYGSIQGAVGGGTNDLETTIKLTTRAKAAGMSVLLDFHYSDFWADPGKQYIPDDWKSLVKTTTNSNGEEVNDCALVEQALYNFTKDTLLSMAEANVYPEMVQIGNEINNGLVFPCGRWSESGADRYRGGIALLESGIQAVRDIDELLNTHTDIMLHLAEGGNDAQFKATYTAFDNAGLDYDVIGASYYPIWHGSLSALQNNLDKISAQTGKPVIVVETSYAFTLETNDDPTPNSFSEADVANGGFLATEQGQATAIREIMNVVANVPENKGLGLFYWEPSWIAVDGAGWIAGEGNGWENMALFDYQGKVLDSLDVFVKVSNQSPVEAPTLVSVEPIALEIGEGAELNLPETVSALFTDDAYRGISVSWQNIGDIDTNVPGSYAITGTSSGGFEVKANVTVLSNLVVNSGFESDSLTPWVLNDEKGFFSLYTNADANVHTGEHSLNFWFPESGQGQISQTVTVNTTGTYLITAVSSGSSEGGQSASKLLVSNNGSSQSTPLALNGWAVWTENSLTVEAQAGTQLTITLQINEETGAWGYIDQVKAVRQ